MVKEDSFQLETTDTNIQILKKKKEWCRFPISNFKSRAQIFKKDGMKPSVEYSQN
jgi:hypothetical protein